MSHYSSDIAPAEKAEKTESNDKVELEEDEKRKDDNAQLPQQKETNKKENNKGLDILVQMESLLEKLKICDYEQQFLPKSAAYKALSRHYFVTSTNPGEQFFMFISVAAWLIQLSTNSKYELPQEHDDPNSLITDVLDELRSTGSTVDFPPNKLKTGAGEQNIFVLNKLADVALKQSTFSWNTPTVQAEPEAEEAVMPDESELTVEQFEEDEPEIAEDNDDADGDQFLTIGALTSETNMVGNNLQRKEMLQADSNIANWKAEVERVMPSLKITLKTDVKDWRSRLEQMQTHRNNMVEPMKDATNLLEKLSGNIKKSLDKIASRERYLNQQLESLLSLFRKDHDKLAEVKEQYKDASSGVTDRSRSLAQISEELEQVKMQMENRGSSLTDGAPLVKIKQALTRLQEELMATDVNIGVIEQSLLQAQLRNRTNLQEDMNTLQLFTYSG